MLKKINLFDVFLVVIIIATIFVYQFANYRFRHHELKNIKVEFTSVDNHFITQEMVNNLLKQNLNGTTKILIDNIDLNKLENNLRQNEWIANAELYFDENATLHAQVKQKKAVMRVLKDNESYYLDSEGNKMGLSNGFSAHVPIIKGKIQPKYFQEFETFLKIIQEDEFMKNALTAVEINADQSANLFVRDYNYIIEFGKMVDVQQKIQNYKAFVHYASKDTLMQQYKKINLRFVKQVIASKN